jgi:hypothetical protein
VPIHEKLSRILLEAWIATHGTHLLLQSKISPTEMMMMMILIQVERWQMLLEFNDLFPRAMTIEDLYRWLQERKVIWTHKMPRLIV